jgi:leucyl aminopeptidase
MFTKNKKNSTEITILKSGDLNKFIDSHNQYKNWIHENNFKASPGQYLIIPSNDGQIERVLVGRSDSNDVYRDFFCYKLSKSLPNRNYYFSNLEDGSTLPYLSWALGNYRYNSPSKNTSKLYLPEMIYDEVQNLVKSIFFTMDLINHPANILNTENFSKTIKKYFDDLGCKVSEISGKALIKENLPLIYEVGKASDYPPRLVDIQWGNKKSKKITLVGKGVTFDTGGLDIKPSSGMLLMKKDMGGAANILGLASMLVLNQIDINLRVLIPIVENSISGNAFRPGDILTSRNGTTVEIGNTDAEGRLILADALTLADEESPEIIIDMATLTGAARVAMGPEIVPFFSTNEDIATTLQNISFKVQDPVWQMPFFEPYGKWLNNDISDINNSPNTPFAGSIIAAEFLKKFIKNTKTYIHFDVYSWNNGTNSNIPKGGAAQGIRAIYKLLVDHIKN